MEFHTGGVQILHILELAPTAGAQVHNIPHKIHRGDNVRPNDGLLRHLDDRRVGIVGGVIDIHHFPVSFGDAVNNGGGRGDQVQVELPFQTLLDDLHVQKT